MSDQSLRESLSALVDGELEPEAADRVLDAVLADPSLYVGHAHDRLPFDPEDDIPRLQPGELGGTVGGRDVL